MNINEIKSTFAFAARIAAVAAFLGAAALVAAAQYIAAGEIVYSRQPVAPSTSGTIWAVAPDGTGNRQIAVGSQPRISPNGRYLLFRRGQVATEPYRFGQLWLRDLTTGTETSIASYSDYLVGYDFTADSTRIVLDDPAASGIRRMNLDGTGRVGVGLTGSASDDFPALRRSDDLIAHHRYDGSASSGIYLISSTTGFQQLVPNTLNKIFPSWSPDGQYIAFGDGSPLGPYPYDVTSISKIRPDGTGKIQLTGQLGTTGFGSGFVWTPDSAYIIAPGSVSGLPGLWRIDVNGASLPLRIVPTTGALPDFVGGIYPARALGPVVTVNDPGDADDAVFGDGVCETAAGNGVCTLRAAIREANASAGFQTIRFSALFDAPQTISLPAGQLNVFSALSIVGPGARLLTVRNVKLPGPSSRVFNIDVPSGAVGISGLTITGGSIPASTTGGGGILNSAATLTLTDCVVTGNSSPVGAGGIVNSNDGYVIINNSLVADNVKTSSVDDGAGGVYNAGRRLDIVNSTLSGNSAPGGAFNGGAVWSSGQAFIFDSTISGNSAGTDNQSAGGVYSRALAVTAGGSIIAGNSGATRQPDVAGSFGDGAGGYNLIGIVGAATGLAGPGTQAGTAAAPLDPRLGRLADNGGPTPTFALLRGSPAIDKGSRFDITEDQRHRPRPFDDPAIPNADSGADIGAFEADTPVVDPVVVSLPAELAGSPRNGLVVPVNVGDTTGRAIISFDFRLTYDPAVFAPAPAGGAVVTGAGTLSNGFELNASSPSPGTLIVSGFGTAPLSGEGVLLNVRLDAIGAPSACSPLGLVGFVFNEGAPASTATGGAACIAGGNVGGAVTYGAAGAFPAVAVPAVRLSVAGPTVVPSATTGTDGRYSLSGFGGGAYVVTPSKTGDANGAITSFDASLISKYLTGAVALNPAQLAAADVSGNGAVTSFDASLVAQTVLGIANSGNVGNWRFLPASRAYAGIAADLANEDYAAVLMGEVSGNWTPSAAAFRAESAAAAGSEAVAVSLPAQTHVRANADVSIPVAIGSVAGRGISSFDFDVVYDPAVIVPQSPAAVSSDTMSRSFSVGTNEVAPGKLRVSGYGAVDLAGSGTLLRLGFRAVGPSGAGTAVAFERFKLNEGDPAVSATGGTVSVVPAAVAATAFDFDGDRRTDLSVFRPSTGEWRYRMSGGGGGEAFARFGGAADELVPGDFTGDPKADIAFWRPSTGEWFVLRSDDLSYFALPFGAPGDIPAPADFDGDGVTDPAVFRPSAGTWFILRSSDGGTSIAAFGTVGDKPVPADFDGDGRADIGVYRASSGEWWYSRSSTGVAAALRFGTATDMAAPGDYTGDGRADFAVFRPATGVWYVLRSENGAVDALAFGAPGDIPAPGDYDGDGRFDAAVFRPSGSTWLVNRSTAGIAIVDFGGAGDQPVPGAFVR